MILPTTQRLSLLETLVQVVFRSNVIILDCIDGSPGQVTLDQIIAVIVLFLNQRKKQEFETEKHRKQNTINDQKKKHPVSPSTTLLNHNACYLILSFFFPAFFFQNLFTYFCFLPNKRRGIGRNNHFRFYIFMSFFNLHIYNVFFLEGVGPRGLNVHLFFCSSYWFGDLEHRSLTKLVTSLALCDLNHLRVWKMSTLSSVSNRSILKDRARNTPVRPSPLLKTKSKSKAIFIHLCKILTQ